MQLQKWHWCATTIVSIYKWGSLPCSDRNDTDVSLLLFQYTSEDLYHAATEMTLMCHYSCFNIQVRISTMQLQKWHWCATTVVSIYKWGSLPCSFTEMPLMCHYCFNIQVRISTMQLQKWHWCATTLVSIYKWGSLPCSYRNDTDVPLLLFQYTSEDLYHVATEMPLMCHYSFQYTSEDLYHVATEMTLMCHYSCFNIQVRISTMQLQKWHWCATTLVSIYKWGSLPCSYRNDTDVPLHLFQYTSEDLYHVTKKKFVPSICIILNSRLLIFIQSVKEQLFETTLTSFGDVFGTGPSWVLSIWKDKVVQLYSCHQAI